MPSVNAIKTNFTAGEISPLLFARVDLSKYANGAQQITNGIVQRYGGVKKRGGTEYIAATKDSSKLSRLVKFVYSKTQSYILEFGDEYIRFYTNGGQVQSGMSAVEVSTPYDEADLFGLQFAQSADVLYIVHPDYAPRQLVRNSATSFTLSTVSFEDGPYLEVSSSGTTLTPADYGSVVPKMTGLTAPSGTVTSSTSAADAWEAFDKDKTSAAGISATSGWIAYDIASTGTAVADAYYLTAPTSFTDTMPVTWQFQGYNGSSWVTLDSRTGENGWSGGETRFYEFLNETAFDGYRLIWTDVDSDTASSSNIAEIGIHKKATTQTAFNLTASATTGINDNAGFATTDVGRPIRLLGSDGVWRWAKIIARTSTTVVTIQLYGHALPDLNPIANWQLGAWSTETGWPSAIAFYEGRLVFASTDEQPQTVWFSQVDDFTNFGVSDPLVDSDAITVTISSEEINSIRWISEGSDLFVGTTAAIRTIGPNTATGTFSPTNIRSKRETSHGASEVQPVRVGNVLIHSGYYNMDLREVAYSFEADGYASQDMSILAEHIVRGGIKELAYSQTPVGVVWAAKSDGTFAALTYEREQEVVAFGEHEFGGNSVTIESVETIPGTDRDEVWLLVKRTVNGSVVRYIERLSEGHELGGNKDDATFLDCHLNYSGSSTTTLTGLDHLEGEDVTVWSDAGQQGPYTVSSGSITVDDAVTVACVGYTYDMEIETLSPEVGAGGGTAQTRFGNISEIFVRVHESQGGTLGPTDFNEGDGTLETLEYPDATEELFTGDIRVPIDMEWNRGKRAKLKHTTPRPFYLLGMIAELRVSG